MLITMLIAILIAMTYIRIKELIRTKEIKRNFQEL